jgi:UDP-3-O-[3-hydroxymyristoyl] N-acetylglucosamine deacetylase / 3-hydroxyacyl-[acyl-carrier-protein] dehydratase
MNLEFNRFRQHTIASEASISGPGLHTGIFANMKLKPEKPGYGLRFQRIDLLDRPIIAADCDLVSDTFRCTTLSDHNGSISTVEHILAALVATGIDNCLIEVNGPEVPIIDGSCIPFVKLIERAGVVEQNASKTWYSIENEISHYYSEQNVKMVALPSKEYSVETKVDFRSIFLKEQHAVLNRMEDFKKEIAPCRTYCFIHELEMLMDKNLVKGDIVKNAILLIDKPVSEAEMSRLQKKFNISNIEVRKGGYLNNLELRFDNEIARHKLMDVIGDLALIGFPINARILGVRPGHSTNLDFAKRIKRHILKINANKPIASRVF